MHLNIRKIEYMLTSPTVEKMKVCWMVLIKTAVSLIITSKLHNDGNITEDVRTSINLAGLIWRGVMEKSVVWQVNVYTPNWSKGPIRHLNLVLFWASSYFLSTTSLLGVVL